MINDQGIMTNTQVTLYTMEERTMMAQLGQNINTKHYIFRNLKKGYIV